MNHYTFNEYAYITQGAGGERVAYMYAEQYPNMCNPQHKMFAHVYQQFCKTVSPVMIKEPTDRHGQFY